MIEEILKMGMENLLKVVAILAGIITALVAALVSFYGQLKIKDYELRIQRKKDKEAYLRKYYIPLLRFSYDLDRRIGHILREIDKDWLNGEYLKKITNKEGFAANPTEKGYFIISSVYMFSCFFGWIEAIKRGVDTTKSLKEETKFRKWIKNIWQRFGSTLLVPNKVTAFTFDPEISRVSKIFQYKELFNEYMSTNKLTEPRDAANLHKQFQYSIGELMLESSDPDSLRCKSFREFFEAYTTKEEFRYWFLILEELFIDLKGFEKNKDLEIQVLMKNDVRPLRLLAIRYWLRELMKKISTELNIKPIDSDEVFLTVNENLKKTIKSPKFEELESYLLGGKI